MKLGMITWITEEEFKKAEERKLEFVELDVNDRNKEFLEHIDQVKAYSKQYHMPVRALGRWGSTRITRDGIKEEELQAEYHLIDAAAQLQTEVYITGCNYVEELSYFENCRFAIAYFEKLIAYAKKYDMKIATYNCRWNNFVYGDMAWTMIHGYLKDLYIKYDVSHCVYDGGDYQWETEKWGGRFAHVHIKGSLLVNGSRVDDPPAGLDQTDWKAFLGLLYARGYDGGLSIEPHSEIWKGELGEKGIDHTIEYMRKLIV